MRVTYSKAQWDDAQDAWARGEFSAEWDDWRKLAAKGPGIIWPPEGTPYDDWTADDPSQRALVIRAIRETPELLRWALTSTKRASWHAVLDRVLDGRDELRESRDIGADSERRARADETTPRQAVYSLKAIFDMVRDS